MIEVLDATESYYTLVELSSFSSTRVGMAGPGLWPRLEQGDEGPGECGPLTRDTSGGLTLNTALVLLLQ